jgi:asparagine synthetase B (glutamine-hydrolysing)
MDPESIQTHHHVSQRLHCILDQAVQVRIESIPLSVAPNGARLGILFSGGLDCTALACLANLHVPIDEPIDLLNVAFENPRTLKRGIVGPHVFDVPDRLTGIKAWRSLQASFPRRSWRFVSINVTQKEYQEAKDRVIRLMSPSGTVMDLSIAIALWFASSGRGMYFSTVAS